MIIEIDVDKLLGFLEGIGITVDSPYVQTAGRATRSVGALPVVEMCPVQNAVEPPPGYIQIGSSIQKPTETVPPVAPPIAYQSAVDVTGCPWDARIHSSTKSKCQDGTWKRKKGISDVLYHQVMAELNPPPPNTGSLPEPPMCDRNIGVALPPPPRPPVINEPVTTGMPLAEMTFGKLMKSIIQWQTAGKLNEDYLNYVLSGKGLQGIEQIVAASEKQPGLIPEIFSKLEATCGKIA